MANIGGHHFEARYVYLQDRGRTVMNHCVVRNSLMDKDYSDQESRQVGDQRLP